MTKPRSRAGINLAEEHKIPRHIERIRTLDAALEKAARRLAAVQAGTETHWKVEQLEARIAQLQAEKSERLTALRGARDQITTALGDG